MALPPKKKYKTKPSKMAQAASEQAALKKMINVTILFLLVPLIIVGVKQVNPGIFYIGQATVQEKFRQYDAAARSFEHAYDADPKGNLGALVNAIRIHEYQEHWDAVRELSQTILKEDSGAGKEERAAANFFLCRIAYEEKRWDDAIVLAEKATKDADGIYEYRAWVMTGAILTEIATRAGDQNQYTKAWDAFETALSLRRLFAPEAHYYQGRMFEVWKNQKADAMDEYDYGLSQQPDPKLREKLMQAKSRLVNS